MTTQQKITIRLYELGYMPGDEVVVDDLAIAAKDVGFTYDLNNDEDCEVLSRASRAVTDGASRCCGAYTSIGDDGMEFCKSCFGAAGVML